MIYFIFCEEKEILKKEISKICQKSDTISIDFKKEEAFSFINEALSIDLFNNEKTFIIENANFLEIKSHGLIQKTLDKIKTMLKTSHYNFIFILKKELNPNLEIIQDLKDLYQYHCIKTEQKDIDTYINDFVVEHKINIKKNTLLKIKDNLNNDLVSIFSELQKLQLLVTTEEITETIVEQNSYKNITSDVFYFIEKIFLNKTSEAKYIYDNLVEFGNNPVTLLELFATQIKFYYQVELLSRKYNSKEISTLLKANPYRVKKVLTLTKKVSCFSIINKYKKTALLEFYAKSGKINHDILFDLLIQN